MRERLDELTARLAGHVENLVLFDVAESTHALARRIISEMDEESQKLGATLILADRQTKGEGRGGRGWDSPAGGLYLNWLRSGIKAEMISQLPMLAATAAHEAISRIGVSGARIKWPNDILVGGKKIAGILVYARHGVVSWVTIGLGVNLATAPVLEEEGPLATSVAEEVGASDIDAWRQQLTFTFIDELDRLMQDPKPALVSWRELLIQRPGDRVNVRLASGEIASGELLELTSEGFLKISSDGKDRVITGGDVIES